MVKLYAAYSHNRGAMAFTEVPNDRVTTANRAKKLMGISPNSWLYLRIPKHEESKKCTCMYCVGQKHGRIFDRPSWVRKDERWPSVPYPFIRGDIHGKNARLSLLDGTIVIGVQLRDMDLWSIELQGMGRTGMLLAADWYQSEDKSKWRESLEQ